MPIGGNVIGSAILEMGVNTRAWSNGLDQASKKWVSFGANVRVAAFRLGTIWAATVGAFTVGVVKIGSSFEKEFTGVRKTVKGTEEQFSKLRKELLDTSTVTTFTADQLAILARKGGQLGIATENLGKFTETIAKLGVAAAELSAEEAAVGLSRLMAITGESQENVDILATVLARLGDSFATTESRILNFAVRIAGLSKVTNMTATDTLALSAAFTSVVPGVELVATQLSKGMAIFANAVASGGDKLKVLDELVSHTGQKFSTIFAVDAKVAITEFLQGLDNVRTSGGNVFKTLADLGLTNQRAAQAFLAAAGATEQFRKALVITNDELEKARTDQSKINKAFAEQMQTFSAKWIVLWNNIKKVAIDFFTAFEKEVKQFLDIATDIVKFGSEVAAVFAKLPSPVKTFMIAMTGLSGALIAASAALGLIISTIASLVPMAAAGKTALTTLSTSAATSATTMSAAATTTGGFTTSVTNAGAATAVMGSKVSGVIAVVAKFALTIGVLAVAAEGARKWLGTFGAVVGEMKQAFSEGTLTFEKFELGMNKISALLDPFHANIAILGKKAEEASRGVTILAEEKQKLLDKVKGELKGIQELNAATKGYTTVQKKMVEHYMALDPEMTASEAAMIVFRKEMAKATEDAKEHEEALKRIREQLAAWRMESAGAFADHIQELQKASEEAEFIDALRHTAETSAMGDSFVPAVPGMGDIYDPNFTSQGALVGPPVELFEAAKDRIKQMEEAQRQYNRALQNAQNIAQLFNGTLGSIIGSTISAASAIGGIAKIGQVEGGGFFKGISSTFGKASDEAGGGIMGAISGVGAVTSLLGPLIGVGQQVISKLFGRGGPFGKASIESIVQSEMGVGISEGLAKAIEASGQPVQLALAQIFQEGAMSVDTLATEIGDLFSFFSRGEISESQLFGALSENIPLLIENFDQLGEAGQAQVQRIINAAKEMGIEFEGLGELIATAMGPSLQDVMETFDLTNQQARELSELLGVKLPTDTQVLAAQLGVTPKQLKEIGAALEEQFGIPLEQIQALLDMTGVSIEDLAKSLGIEGVEATDALKDAQEVANANMETGVDIAIRLADELERAAAASHGINIPATGGGGEGIISAAKGFDSGPINKPTFFPIMTHPGERLRVADTGAMAASGGGGINISVAPQIVIAEPLASDDDIARRVVPVVVDAVKNDMNSIVGEIGRKLENS